MPTLQPLFDPHLIMGRQVGARGLSHRPQGVVMDPASAAEWWGVVFFYRQLLEITFVYPLCSYPSHRRKVRIRAKTKQARKQNPDTAAQSFSSIQSGFQRHPISNPNPGAYIFQAPQKETA